MSRRLTAEGWIMLGCLWTVMALWLAETVRTALAIGKRPSLPRKDRTE